VSEFQNAFPHIAVALHLHDTRGTGMANVYAGLLCGVERFDCSVGGMGGCPFSPGAAGNVPTEDVLFLCQELGIETGVNLDAYIDAAQFAESVIGHTLPGKVKQSRAR
jgi:hydroxymethylglutaryl-CoA lyase